MSNEVTEYLVSRGELLRADNLRPAEVNRLVDAEAYRALEAECDKWHQQFDCMQLQRDHHRNTVKALRAELERVRQGSLFLLDAHAELEAARKQEPVAYVLFRDGEVCYESDDSIVISNTPGDETDLYKWLPVFTIPPLAGKVSVPRELLEQIARGCSCEVTTDALDALLATPSMEVKS